MCDVAGEIFNVNSGGNEITRQIGFRYANAFILIIDPLSISEYRNEIAGTIQLKDYNKSDLPLDEMVDVFIRTLQNMFSIKANAMLNTNVAVIFTKIDIAYVPVVVVGELLYGAYNSSNPKNNLELFKNVLTQFEQLPISFDVANSYALVKSDLKKIGKPIPENDIWIAATAHAYNLPLATFDTHFKNIRQITLFNQFE